MQKSGWLVWPYLLLSIIPIKCANLTLYDQFKNLTANSTEFKIEELASFDDSRSGFEGSGDSEDLEDTNNDSVTDYIPAETNEEDSINMELIKDHYASQGYLIDGDYPDDWDLSKPMIWENTELADTMSSITCVSYNFGILFFMVINNI